MGVVLGQVTPGRELLTRGALRSALAALLFGLAACASPPPEVPAPLRGRWTTADPRFVGRAMELTIDGVAFETGEGSPARHPVLAVAEDPREGGSRRYTIVYAGDGGNEYRLTVRYDEAAGELRLENRAEVVWRREGGS